MTTNPARQPLRIPGMTDTQSAQANGGRRRRILVGGAAGLLAAAAGVGASEAIAVLTGPATSSLVAVGSAAIDLTPQPLKDFAIRTFGEADKLVLMGGMLTAIALTAVVAGVLAFRTFWAGAAIVFGFGAVGAIAALTRPVAGALDVLPSVGAALIATGALFLLVRAGTSAPSSTPAPDSDTSSAGESGESGEAQDSEASGDEATVRRRSLLVTSAAVAGVAVVGGLGGRVLQAKVGDVQASRAGIRLPSPASPAPELPAGHRLRVRGLGPFFTPNADFYRVDTALTLPRVAAERWSLRIGGAVGRQLELTYDDLLKRPLVERDLTLSCVSNEVGGPYVGTARWLGVSLKDLLEEAGVGSQADQLLSRSHDGMTIGTPMEVALDGRDALLAVAMNGEPLPVENGFPVRMIIPGLYGYTSATKWLVELEATRFDQVDAYWTERDWDPVGRQKTQSRIDVPKPFAQVPAGEVVVAGVAWAPHRGISTVQVRMDGGPWEDAELTEPVSVDTWRQWRVTFTAQAGTRRFEVKAADGTGDLQTEERVPPFPAGSSGWHSVAVTVTP